MTKDKNVICIFLGFERKRRDWNHLQKNKALGKCLREKKKMNGWRKGNCGSFEDDNMLWYHSTGLNMS